MCHRQLKSFLLAAVVIVASFVACAHGGSRVSPVQWTSGEWSFVPTISQSGSRMDSLLALRTSGTIMGNNITGVWFKRGATTWRAVAWEEQDISKVITNVKGELGIDDHFDSLWPVSPNAVSASPYAAFTNGVFSADPVRVAIEQSADPEDYVQQLVASGWPAAFIAFEVVDLVGGCDEFAILDTFALAVEMEISPAYVDGAGVAASVAARQNMACGDWCWENDWTIAGPTLVSCTNTGWTLISGPTWVGAQCHVVCWFQTTQTCSWTKTKMHENWDCSTCTYTQTGTCSGPAQAESIEFFDDPCVQPATMTCPAAPDDAPPPCGPSGVTWVGSPPCD